MKSGLNVATALIFPVLCVAPMALMAQNAAPNMSFFVTSVGPGDGANLKGLAGADAHCQALAQAKGVGNRTWRAYLSTQGASAVNAKDRIGNGPWNNAKGVQVAQKGSSIESRACVQVAG